MAVNVATAPAGLVASRVMGGGIVIEGAVVSTTITWNEADPGLPCESVAVQVTVVLPSGKRLPDTGAQVGVMLPSTRSNAVAVNVAVAPAGPVASLVMSAGTVTTGPLVSTTITWN